MNKASPVEMRKCLEAVEVFKKAGILFVPMPVFNENDNLFLVKVSQKRLQEIFEKTSNVNRIDISPSKKD